VTASAPAARPRRRWDGFRRISAWAGLLEAVTVVVIVATLGHRLTGGGQDQATTWAIVIMLAAPAVLAGLVSGSRFLGLYAGYAQRLDPTAELSAEDSAAGTAAASSVIGDALWGSLIAGAAGSIPAALAFTMLFGPFAVIMAPVFMFVIGIAWFTGWAAGGVASLVLSTAIGIAVGAGRRERRGNRLVWILVAAFLPLLLIAVVVPVVGIRFDDGRPDAWGAIFAILDPALGGAEFLLAEPLVWVARVSIWLAVLLFAAIVVAGTPALLHRLERREAAGEVS
jgi:hypothetical protein